MNREQFEKEDDQFHNMMMRYHWQHHWKEWEMKMKSIFGDPKDEDSGVVREGDFEWEPGESLNRLNDPSFQENVKNL